MLLLWLLLLIELGAVEPLLLRDRLLKVECRVLPRSPRDGEVADETDPGPPPVVDEAVDTAVPGGLMLLIAVPPSACDDDSDP